MLAIRQLTAAEGRQHIDALAATLLDCVEGGASVSFMPPFAMADAVAFFENVPAAVERGERLLLAAFLGSELVGTVQILTAMPPKSCTSI